MSREEEKKGVSLNKKRGLEVNRLLRRRNTEERVLPSSKKKRAEETSSVNHCVCRRRARKRQREGTAQANCGVSRSLLHKGTEGRTRAAPQH